MSPRKRKTFDVDGSVEKKPFPLVPVVRDAEILPREEKLQRPQRAPTRTEEALARLAPHEHSFPEPVREKVQGYYDESLSENSRLARESDLRLFQEWCKDQAPARSWLPATPETVAGYLTWMAEKGHPWVTISRRLSSISQEHLSNQFDSPRDHQGVRKVCRGIRRTHGVASRFQKKALVAVDLARVIKGIKVDTAIGVRDRAMVLLGFACAFRRSELSAIDVDRLEFVTKGLIVNVAKSKTDQEGKGAFVGVPMESAQTISAVQEWLKVFTRREGPIFPRFTPGANPSIIEGSRLGPKGVGKAIIRAFERGEIMKKTPRRKPVGDKRRMATHGAHSLRAGFITQAAMDGKTLDVIMSQTRHKTPAQVLAYIRRADVFKDNAARGTAL